MDIEAATTSVVQGAISRSRIIHGGLLYTKRRLASGVYIDIRFDGNRGGKHAREGEQKSEPWVQPKLLWSTARSPDLAIREAV